MHDVFFGRLFLQQIEAVVEADILAAGTGHLDDKVGAGDEVAQLTEGFGEDAAVVEVLGLAEDEVEAVEGALQSEVAADDADIVGHDFLQFALGLGDEHHLLVEHHALGIPIGNLIIRSTPITLNALNSALRGVMSVDNCLKQ